MTSVNIYNDVIEKKVIYKSQVTFFSMYKYVKVKTLSYIIIVHEITVFFGA